LLQKPLVPAARISGGCKFVTRPDQGVEQAGALDLASSKGPDKPVVWKTWCNSGQFYRVLSEDFWTQKFVIKIHAHLYR